MTDPIWEEPGDGFDIVGLQDIITAKVKDTFPNTLVLEDTIEDDRAIPRDDNGKVTPYFILRFGPIKAKRREKSFRGPRADGYFGTVDVIAIAPQGKISRRMNAAMVDRLIGFKPDGVNPMGLRGEEGDPSQFVVASNEARPTQNVCSTRMQFAVNTKNIGAPAPLA